MVSDQGDNPDNPSDNDDESNKPSAIIGSTDKTAVLQNETTFNKEIQKAKEQEACLIIIRGTPQGHRYFLNLPELTIGRDPTADVTVNDSSISRKHAIIHNKNSKVTLTDLGSSNGTFVNGKKIAQGIPVGLGKEDMIKMGNSIFKFLPAGEIEIIFYGNLGSAAHTDSLTGIYNKGYLHEALEAEFKRTKALHSDLSVIFFDLDHFKKVNDTFGHDAGDFVLKEFTALVKGKYVRPKDVFARYGGEEFVLLLTNTNVQSAQDIAEQIRNSIETHAFVYEGKRIPVTTSLGVAEVSSDMESAQTFLKSADKALYSAKNSGRNKVVCA